MARTAILSVRIISDAKNAVTGFKDAEGAAGGFGSKVSSVMGRLGPIAMAGVGAAAAGIGMAGKALYDLGGTFDEVADTIRVGTGATGDALQGLIDDAHAVATSVPTDFETAGSVVADLNTRLGLSGDTLQTVASQYLEAGRILGEDVDIQSTTAAFSAFGIEGAAVEGAMDSLFQVSQATGVSMNDLAGSAQKNAGAMSELGFTFDDTIALVGSLDKAGIDADGTLTAMRKGLMNVAQPGQDLGDAFYETTDKIAAFVRAGDDAAALDLAGTVFGTKGAAQMVQAIKDGTLAVDDLKAHTGATSDTILGVGQDTQDAAEKWQILKNKGMEALEPLASAVFNFAGDALDAITGFVDGVDLTPVTNAIGGLMDGVDLTPLSSLFSGIRDAVSGLVSWVQGLDLSSLTGWIQPLKDGAGQAASKVQDISAKIAPLGQAIAGVLGPVIETLAPALGTAFSTAADIIGTAVTTIWTVLSGLIDVVTGVFTGIRALVTGDWQGVWDSASQILSGAWSAISAIFSGAASMVGSALRGIVSAAGTILSGLGSLLSSLFSGAWNAARGAVSSGVSTVVGLVRSLPGQAVSALGNLGSTLWNAGKSLISGFIEGIKHMFSSVKNTLGDLTSKLTSWKGPEDLDRRLLTPAGQMIIGGLIRGLESQYPAVRATLTGLTGMIAGTDLGALTAPTIGVPTGRAATPAGGTVINVTVNGAVDPESTARQIRRILAAYDTRHYGRAA